MQRTHSNIKQFTIKNNSYFMFSTMGKTFIFLGLFFIFDNSQIVISRDEKMYEEKLAKYT